MTNTATTATYSFPAARLGEFNGIIEKANRRLAKAGATALFAPSVTLESRTETTESGIEISVEYAVATLDTLRLSLGDFTFVASLVPEEAGYTVHTAPGQSLDGWTRPAIDDTSCDHCKVNRFRNRLYIVRNDKTGELIQLGHNCIQLFTGLEPKGLWALEFGDVLQEFASEGHDSFGGGRGEFAISVNTILAISYVLSNEGRGYISKAKAEEWDKASTVELIQSHLFSPPKNPNGFYSSRNPNAYAEYQAYVEACEKAAEVSKNEALLDAIKASVETVKAGTDYGDNLRVILSSDVVSRKNIGILASLVAVYRRNLDQNAQDKAPKAAAGYLGNEGDKLANVTITVKTVKYWEGDYGTTTFIVGNTADGHVVVWKASKYIDLESGEVLVIKSAKVKKTEHAYGADQTIITHARLAA